ncbi:MAG: hypothetical protein U1E62_00255 [Alsobacter sp.]
MPSYTIHLVGPMGPVATERVEASDAARAGQLGLALADELLDFGAGLASRRARWTVRVLDATGDILMELPVKI